ncbi:hypothetical protein BRADI_1g30383v3 [Brachypodium distachyon]|uniref:GCK domain-containing protein n=1 Tax=Brachypodium distachyon TaxID=15368 RepID=A0A0Q3H1A7_BRADI|nr:hypothetical protein BRADI_1g30383v3 [Brachypodium distachyon]
MCLVIRSMEAGGCADEFWAATRACHPQAVGEDPDDVDACVRATAALRKCMKSNKAVFKGYIRILDEEVERQRRRRAAKGEAEPPAADRGQDEEEFPRRFMWWTGVRRS